MTKRTVIWAPEAEAELAEIWLASASRELATLASNRIDAVLKHQAELAGNLLAEDMRAFDEPPLRVLFEILDEDRVVRVLKVKPVSWCPRVTNLSICAFVSLVLVC